MKLQMETQQAIYQVNNALYRSFQIRGFGVYNCDCPYNLPQGGSVAAKFVDDKGKNINFNQVQLIELSKNMMFNYYSGNRISLIQKQKIFYVL